MKLKELFYFPKSDRKGIAVALAVAAIAVLGIWIVGSGNTTAGDDAADKVVGGMEASGKAEDKYYAVEESERELTYFDPNTADSTTLLKMGLQPWQVRNIYKYRAKGGVYREPQDFAKVYGLTVKQYRELEPYIRISSDYRPAAEVYARQNHNYRRSGGYSYNSGYGSSSSGQRTASPGAFRDVTPSHVRDTVAYPVKLKPGERIDLNAADTSMLKKVPGIGSFFARKVVAYRERLGGFYSAQQLLEIEGFPEEAQAFFTVRPGMVRRINVNKLTLSQMRQHPYINFYMAKAIADRRRLKGPLASLNDLSLLPDFTPEVIERLSHYVEF